MDPNPSEIHLPCSECLKYGWLHKPRYSPCPFPSVVRRDEFLSDPGRVINQLMASAPSTEQLARGCGQISAAGPFYGLNLPYIIDSSEPNQYETPPPPYYMEANQNLTPEQYGAMNVNIDSRTNPCDSIETGDESKFCPRAMVPVPDMNFTPEQYGSMDMNIHTNTIPCNSTGTDDEGKFCPRAMAEAFFPNQIGKADYIDAESSIAIKHYEKLKKAASAPPSNEETS